MNLDVPQRWHWALIGATAGLLVGFALATQPPAPDNTIRPPLSVEQFVTYAQAKAGQPVVDRLVIEPSGSREDFVTGETVAPNGARRPFAMYTRRPFDVGDAHAASVVEFVRRAAVANPRVRFEHRWWHATWSIATIGAATGMAVIGGLWPTLINLTYFGRLRRPRVQAEEYDLSRFISDPAPAATDPRAHALGVALGSETPPEVPTEPAALSRDDMPAPALVPGLNDALPSTGQAEEEKDYRGEYYPVAKPHHADAPQPPPVRPSGFSLLELLVVLAVVAVLTSLLLPTVRYARRRAQSTVCANHLRQIAQATVAYANDNTGVLFWRGDDINLDGMDWYAYGGRSHGNANMGQANYFNRMQRPLNRYVGDRVELFRCPNDDAAPWSQEASIWPAESQFDWVGNSYNFNANGYPLRPTPRHDGGLDGVRYSGIRSTSDTLMYYEANLVWGADWHLEHKANLAFADGHIEFGPLPPWHGRVKWDP